MNAPYTGLLNVANALFMVASVLCWITILSRTETPLLPIAQRALLRTVSS
ncbi:MAG: hypothetical protein AABX72_00675 [Nanoarchaeota archaeon]